MSYLQQAVPDNCDREFVTMPLQGSTGIFCRKHGREVKHGNIGLAVVIDSVVQTWKLVIGGEVSRLFCIGQQCILVYVLSGQELHSVIVVLQEEVGHQLVLHEA